MALSTVEWSVHALATELRIAPRSMSLKLEGCRFLSEKKTGRGRERLYALADVFEHLLRGSPRGADGEIDPEKLEPKARLDWYNGEKARRDLQIKDGELIPATDVEVEIASIVKSFSSFVETLPDSLERDTGIPPETVKRIQEMCDEYRDRLYRQLTT